MTYRTVILSDFESYLANEHTGLQEFQSERREREARLENFPHTVLLQLAFAEFDFANRWCWQRFGPAEGLCLQADSEYPACTQAGPHSHDGRWMFEWLGKTDYNFGFNEWYFRESSERDQFLDFVPMICWGEKYPK